MRRLLSLGVLGLPCVIGQALQIQAVKLQGECGTLYTVVANDGCWSIAGAAHITQEQLVALNPGLNCATLQVGQGLCLGLPCAKTYEVAQGDWCAKIEGDQKISETDLLALNPGLNCSTIFPGQRLCLEAPVAAPPGDPLPPWNPPSPEVAPTTPCDTQVSLVKGDTCYDVATANGLQLAQFMALNKNINCSAIQAGDVACVFPACGEAYWVQSGNWCAQIETDHGLAAGQLVKLNPALSCDALAPGQLLCVEPPAEEEPEPPYKPTLNPWDEFAALSPGTSILKSPLISFMNSDNPRKTFFGELMFQLDGQHSATFRRIDRDGDGKLNSTEVEAIVNVYPVFLRGLSAIDANLASDKVVNQIIRSIDRNGDGLITEDEYLFSVYQVQQIINDQEETTLRRRAGEHMPVKRDLPGLLLPVGIAGLSAAQVADVLGMMEKKAGDDLSKYLDVAFWDKGRTPEPQCSAILYWSDSCGKFASNAAAKCSDGGDRVFVNSCRDYIGDGARQCEMNKCASLCYKINTDGCACDVIQYTYEQHVVYDTKLMSGKDGITNRNNVGECRESCTTKSDCAGFSVGVNIDGATVTCRLYTKLESKNSSSKNTWITYTKVPRGTSDSDKCPPIPDGYYPISEAQMDQSAKAGEAVADKYSEEEALARRSLNLTTRALPDSYDQRTKVKLVRKNQSGSGLCASFSFTTTVEGSYYNKFHSNGRELSPLWVAMCAAEQKSYREGNTIENIVNKVGKQLIASESCIPFKNKDNFKCDNNCFIHSYLPLPYVTKYIWFPPPAPDNPKEVWDQMKQHLINVGPIETSFQVSESFTDYARDLFGYSTEAVYYDGHPDWPKLKDCPFGGHAMTIIGYGHFKKGGKGRPRLYWIVQNSWGSSSGKDGYVFIAAGSMGTASVKSVGMKVDRVLDEL